MTASSAYRRSFMAEIDIHRLIASYPRSRPALPPGQAAIYEAEYKRNRSGGDAASAIAQRLEAWMHRRIAGDPPVPGAVLEMGAGTLNHLPFEPSDRTTEGYDIVEPQEHLYFDSPHRTRVRHLWPDLARVPADHRYGRIISIAVLEHLPDLPGTLARLGGLLGPGGRMQHGIPSEGGMLWGLAWRGSTGLSYRLRTGFSYRNLMRHEHLSTCGEITMLMRHFFGRTEMSRFPLPGLHTSFYTLLAASEPRLDRCQQIFEAGK